MATIRQKLEEKIVAETLPLTTRGLDLFRTVAGASNLTQILKTPVTNMSPACYVYKARSRAGANRFDDEVSQNIEEQYGIVLVVRNVADLKHGDSSDVMDMYSDALLEILLGYQCCDWTAPFEYIGGQLVGLNNGFLYWQENYKTAIERRSF